VKRDADVERRRWTVVNRASAWIDEPQLAARAALDRVSVLVDISVVTRAHQEGIVDASLTAIGPVVEVMCFDEQSIRATGEPAIAVAMDQRPSERARYRPALARHADRVPVVVLDEPDDAGVAGEPASSLRRDARAVACRCDLRRIGIVPVASE
jgi:hypothetical protein